MRNRKGLPDQVGSKKRQSKPKVNIKKIIKDHQQLNLRRVRLNLLKKIIRNY